MCADIRTGLRISTIRFRLCVFGSIVYNRSMLTVGSALKKIIPSIQTIFISNFVGMSTIGTKKRSKGIFECTAYILLCLCILKIVHITPPKLCHISPKFGHVTEIP